MDTYVLTTKQGSNSWVWPFLAAAPGVSGYFYLPSLFAYGSLPVWDSQGLDKNRSKIASCWSTHALPIYTALILIPVTNGLLVFCRPIHDAVDNNHVELARLMLACGADMRIATYSGRTCVKLARSIEMQHLINGNPYWNTCFICWLWSGSEPYNGPTLLPWCNHFQAFIACY